MSFRRCERRSDHPAGAFLLRRPNIAWQDIFTAYPIDAVFLSQYVHLINGTQDGFGLICRKR